MNINGIEAAHIEVMNKALRHRGPDDSGIYINRKKTVGFGHRRLSIIDIEAGHQPMSNEDETVWITFNGEIYNYQDLKKNLQQRHHFKTQSDTEVILHLYEERGEECVKFLRGMFAFAIYDSRNNSIILSRDHLGQKPLYYYYHKEQFAFASEIKALLELKPQLREMDCNALYEYLTIRIITPPRSMFKKIRKLKPGHQLVFRNGKVKIGPYWQLKYEPKLKNDFRSILNELNEQIRSTIKYHMVSDVSIGAYLSGGMDSGLVAAIMSRVSNEPINTFSGDVPYEDFSEIPYARMVAERYSTHHRELKIDLSLTKALPDLVWHLDEASDPLSICMFQLSKLTREHVKVVLGGDGGDELFGGYDRYYGNVYASYYALIPEAIRRQLLERILQKIPEGFWYRSLSHKLRWMHHMSFYKGSSRYAKSLSYFYFSDAFKKKLYTDKFIELTGVFNPDFGLRKHFDSDNAQEVIDKMLYVDCMTRMPDHPNMILDRMTMAHGLEARSPFLDHKLAEFCAQIPSGFKIKGTKRRYIQTQLAKKYIPAKVLKKKKQGFSSAVPYLLESEFKTLYDVLLRDSHLVKSGYLKADAIANLLDEHLGKKMDHGNRLWLLCNSEIWYRMYIENESRESLKVLLNNPN
jgi:asparagine synthase (glutamine-hydrolysing)